MLSSFCSKNTTAKQRLENKLVEIVDHYVPTCHYITTGLICSETNFPAYIKSSENVKDDVLSRTDQDDAKEIRAFLNELKPRWNAKIRKACEDMLKQYMGGVDQTLFAHWLNKVNKVCKRRMFNKQNHSRLISLIHYKSWMVIPKIIMFGKMIHMVIATIIKMNGISKTPIIFDKHQSRDMKHKRDQLTKIT